MEVLKSGVSQSPGPFVDDYLLAFGVARWLRNWVEIKWLERSRVDRGAKDAVVTIERRPDHSEVERWLSINFHAGLDRS